MVLALVLPAVALAPAPAAWAGGTEPFIPAAIHSDITLTFALSTGFRSDAITATGAGDFNLGAPELSGSLHLNIEGIGSVDVIEVGGNIYSREDNGQWEVESLADNPGDSIGDISALAGGIDFTATDPLQVLRDAGLPILHLPDETMYGLGVHHARVEMDKEQFLQWVEQRSAPLLSLGGLSAEDIRGLRDEVNDVRFSVDIWYGVDDNFPYRTASAFTVDSAIGRLSTSFTMNSLPLRDRVEIVAPI
jgi:hypothetical protein